MTLAAWLVRRSAPALLAGWSVFVLLLAPTFGILRWSQVWAYDRYMQLPALGLAIALAATLAAFWRSRSATATAPSASVAAAGSTRSAVRTALVLAMLLLALAEAMATRATLAHWRDSLTLWQHAASVSPSVPDSHNGLGATYS